MPSKAHKSKNPVVRTQLVATGPSGKNASTGAMDSHSRDSSGESQVLRSPPRANLYGAVPGSAPGGDKKAEMSTREDTTELSLGEKERDITLDQHEADVCIPIARIPGSRLVTSNFASVHELAWDQGDEPSIPELMADRDPHSRVSSGESQVLGTPEMKPHNSNVPADLHDSRLDHRSRAPTAHLATLTVPSVQPSLDQPEQGEVPSDPWKYLMNLEEVRPNLRDFPVSVQTYLRLLGRTSKMEELRAQVDQQRLADAELAGGWCLLKREFTQTKAGTGKSGVFFDPAMITPAAVAQFPHLPWLYKVQAEDNNDILGRGTTVEDAEDNDIPEYHFSDYLRPGRSLILSNAIVPLPEPVMDSTDPRWETLVQRCYSADHPIVLLDNYPRVTAANNDICIMAIRDHSVPSNLYRDGKNNAFSLVRFSLPGSDLIHIIPLIPTALPPVASPPPAEILCPVPDTAPGGDISIIGVGDAAWWARLALQAQSDFYQGRTERHYLTAPAANRIHLAMTQGGFLALDAVCHLEKVYRDAGGMVMGKSSPVVNTLQTNAAAAMTLRLEEMMDWERGTGPMVQQPKRGYSEMGAPCHGLVSDRVIPVLAALNLAEYQGFFGPIKPPTLEELAAAQTVMQCESERLLDNAQAIARLRPLAPVLLMVTNSDVHAHLSTAADPADGGRIRGCSNVYLVPLKAMSSWSKLVTYWGNSKKFGKSAVTVIRLTSHDKRPGPLPAKPSDIDLRFNLQDPRLPPRPNITGIISIDSNIFMENAIPSAPYPAVQLYVAAVREGLEVCVAKQVLVELRKHKDRKIQLFALLLHHGKLRGSINMANYRAPPAPPPFAILPAIDPIQLNKDAAMRWELEAMLIHGGRARESLKMVTADRGMFGHLKTHEIGGILMAQGNALIPMSFAYPVTVVGWIDILRRMM